MNNQTITPFLKSFVPSKAYNYEVWITDEGQTHTFFVSSFSTPIAARLKRESVQAKFIPVNGGMYTYDHGSDREFSFTVQLFENSTSYNEVTKIKTLNSIVNAFVTRTKLDTDMYHTLDSTISTSVNKFNTQLIKKVQFKQVTESGTYDLVTFVNVRLISVDNPSMGYYSDGIAEYKFKCYGMLLPKLHKDFEEQYLAPKLANMANFLIDPLKDVTIKLARQPYVTTDGNGVPQYWDGNGKQITEEEYKRLRSNAPAPKPYTAEEVEQHDVKAKDDQKKQDPTSTTSTSTTDYSVVGGSRNPNVKVEKPPANWSLGNNKWNSWWTAQGAVQTSGATQDGLSSSSTGQLPGNLSSSSGGLR